MGSFLSVTHGSEEPARFLEIHYSGGNPNDPPIVFVGKGVTFGNQLFFEDLFINTFLDSGGISLKPSEGMGSMRGMNKDLELDSFLNFIRR
jgi:aminopeptidase